MSSSHLRLTATQGLAAEHLYRKHLRATNDPLLHANRSTAAAWDEYCVGLDSFIAQHMSDIEATAAEMRQASARLRQPPRGPVYNFYYTGGEPDRIELVEVDGSRRDLERGTDEWAEAVCAHNRTMRS